MNGNKKILEEFYKLKNILDKNNKHFTLIAGSVLGATKFNGLIPWDDDIDIMISKDTYDFLLKAFPNNVITSNDKGYPLMFPKWVPDKANIANSNTFIDLFIVVKTNLGNIKKFRSLKNKIKYANYSLGHGFKAFDFPLKILKTVLFPFKWMTRKNIAVDEAFKILHDPNGDRKFLIVNPADPMHEADVTILSEESIKIKFEEVEVKIPKNFEEYFRHKYGIVNVDVSKKRKIFVHDNTFNISKATWDGNKIIKK